MQPHFSNILMICAYIFKKNKDILFSKTRCSLPFQTNFELTSCAMLSCEFNFQILCLNVHTFTAVVVCVCVWINFNAKFSTIPARFVSEIKSCQDPATWIFKELWGSSFPYFCCRRSWATQFSSTKFIPYSAKRLLANIFLQETDSL